MALQNFDMDDVEKEIAQDNKGKGASDYDCPSCNANNPLDEPMTDGSELRCNYCGSEFLVSMTDGRTRLKEL